MAHAEAILNARSLINLINQDMYFYVIPLKHWHCTEAGTRSNNTVHIFILFPYMEEKYGE